MRAIFIDSTARTIEEIELPEGEAERLAEVNKRVGGGIEFATRFPNGDVLYVNGEGLYKHERFFVVLGAHQPFAGNGVIVGAEVDERQSPAKTQLATVRNMVRFSEVLKGSW